MIDRFILFLDFKEKTYEASKNNFGVFYLFDFIYGCSNGGSEESANVPRTYQDVEKKTLMLLILKLVLTISL
jgi:hypothetical protein